MKLHQHKHQYHKGSQNKAGMARYHASSSSSSTSTNNVGVELCNLAMVALLLLVLLPSAALGRPHQAFSSTGAQGQESKDAALSLPREQEQQLQPPPDLDYLPLEQIPSSLKRRSLNGPGSSPPQCTSKCGRCLPCKPVHVPIQPGLVKTAEYYPEAWRCKCGNKLFMP